MDCIFCKIANKEISSNLVYEDDKVMVIMDIDPICDGHLLLIPKAHHENVFDLPEELLGYMYKIAKIITEKLMLKLDEKGASLAFNYGDKLSVNHAHMHIMPNFEIPASKSVEEIYKLLMED